MAGTNALTVTAPQRPDPASARDHLANERTFLAYVRTALSFVALGFVVARFSLFTREFAAVAHIELAGGAASVQLGGAVAGAGIVIAGFGAYRYIVAYRLLGGAPVALSPAAAVVSAVAVSGFGLTVCLGLLGLR